jgi:RNA polymerase sigma-70 factor, ECF subfamily
MELYNRAPGDEREELDTECLAQLAREGNPEAREALGRKSYSILVRAAEMLLRGRGGGLRQRLEGEDLAQSAYGDALRSVDRWQPRGKGSFRRWLMGVLRNKVKRTTARELAGRRDARKEVALGNLDVRGSSGADPHRRTMRAEERERLARAVAGLPPRWADVVRLRYFEKLSWKEVGNRLGSSEEAAQMLCHRALLKLHAELGETSGPIEV